VNVYLSSSLSYDRTLCLSITCGCRFKNCCHTFSFSILNCLLCHAHTKKLLNSMVLVHDSAMDAVKHINIYFPLSCSSLEVLTSASLYV
jgi:hypothetical protein